MTKGPMTLLTEAYTHKHAGEHERAFELFREAFEMGTDTKAFPSFALAEYYEDGAVVPKDMQLAFHHYLVAAEGKVADAQAKVADWLTSGEHVPKDLEQAAQWRQRAEEQRKQDAQPRLTLAESIRKLIAEQKS